MDHVKHSTVFHDAVSSKGSLARLVMVSAGQCCPDYSAQEITQDYLSRLQSAEPEVQSFISVASESACAAARALDDRIASDGADSLGPLAAVPLGIKVCPSRLPTVGPSLAVLVPAYTRSVEVLGLRGKRMPVMVHVAAGYLVHSWLADHRSVPGT